MNPCELCATLGGIVLWESAACRVVRVTDPHYPGFCRVVWGEHICEMTDLENRARGYLMDVVFGVEAVLRACYVPDKINLASFGNATPHLHWHVIPRWRDDRHFPEPVWGRILREQPVHRREVPDSELQSALRSALMHLEAIPWS